MSTMRPWPQVREWEGFGHTLSLLNMLAACMRSVMKLREGCSKRHQSLAAAHINCACKTSMYT